MKFNKCIRCGCFFSSEDSLCPNCLSRDEIDKLTIRKYLKNNDMPQNVEALAFQSGVELKNVNRYLNTREFSDLKKNFKNSENNINFTL